MKKKFFVFYLFIVFKCFAAGWFERNKNLEVVFLKEVWKYISIANQFSDKGDIKTADLYLRKAKEKTEKCEPFTPTNWPFGWPKDKESLKYLKYATPVAFIYRIIGDFCLDYGYNKEAIKYFEMYISKCVIPDATYYVKLAEIYEKEGMYTQAINLYNEIGKFIENKNYWGENYTLKFIESRVKRLNILLKKNRVVVLFPIFIEIPSAIQTEFFNLFLNEIKNIKNLVVISRNDFERVLREENYEEKNIEDKELVIVGKILNADYVLKPALSKVIDSYILNVDVFSIDKKSWFEHYEYKTEDIKYVPNLIKRFVLNFQGLDISPDLYLPETKFLWSYEADGLITDLKISQNGEKILIGCETGSLYLLDKRGRVLKNLKMSEKIVNVAISQEGEYLAFFTLEGKLYFLSKSGKILWIKKTGNLGRGISISENGRFLISGVDKTLYFIDRNGETFWEIELPDFISAIYITENSRFVFAGTQNGTLYCYKDDGNLNWQKELREKIVNVKNEKDFVCVETEKGKIYLFDLSGNEIKNFKSDEEINFSVFKPEILNLISGKKGNYLYFLSYDKKSLWKYLLKEKISFLFSLPDGELVVSAEGKNLFAFSIIWR
ncbi:MAG: PQQ-binding-like beta-propeller repeat protein [Candidatus Omnitrophica bacterium]|nr:PQQ-binding-like beta-propeller repeat protein [Candidatus Omnitrophota bacterium]